MKRRRGQKGKQKEGDNEKGAETTKPSKEKETRKPRKQRAKNWTWEETYAVVCAVKTNGANFDKILTQLQNEAHLCTDRYVPTFPLAEQTLTVHRTKAQLSKKWNDLCSEKSRQS